MSETGDEQTIIVWEGEWSHLRAAVKATRVALTELWEQKVSPKLPAGCESDLPDFMNTSVTTGLSWAKQTSTKHPWVAPTFGLSGLATVVFARFYSSKGVFVALRRSVLVTTCTAVLLYPTQARLYAKEALKKV